MNRYQVVEETIKNGRKKETNYAILDKFENNVVFRSSDKAETLFLCDRMNERIKEVKEFG